MHVVFTNLWDCPNETFEISWTFQKPLEELRNNNILECFINVHYLPEKIIESSDVYPNINLKIDDLREKNWVIQALKKRDFFPKKKSFEIKKEGYFTLHSEGKLLIE